MRLFQVEVFDPVKGVVVPRHLPVSTVGQTCELAVEGVEGATGIFLAVCREGVGRRCWEIPMEGSRTARVLFTFAEEPSLTVTCGLQTVFQLPADTMPDPPRLVVRDRASALQVVVVVDGTTQSSRDGAVAQRDRLAPAFRLLSDSADDWKRHAAQIVSFIQKVCRDGANLQHACVLAFGDSQVPDTHAADLQARYVLHPTTPELKSLTAQGILDALLALPSTSGGDYVDALAEGLSVCADLAWCKHTSKIVIVTGDSPGGSVLHPPPRGANLQFRRHDVDAAASAFFGKGIDIVTVFHASREGQGHGGSGGTSVLEAFSRQQYRRIASVPRLAFDAGSFDPAKAAEEWWRSPCVFGRGVTWGIVPPDGR